MNYSCIDGMETSITTGTFCVRRLARAATPRTKELPESYGSFAESGAALRLIAQIIINSPDTIDHDPNNNRTRVITAATGKQQQ